MTVFVVGTGLLEFLEHALLAGHLLFHFPPECGHAFAEVLRSCRITLIFMVLVVDEPLEFSILMISDNVLEKPKERDDLTDL